MTKKRSADSKVVQALRLELGKLNAQRDDLSEQIMNTERALSLLLSHRGESFNQLIDMAKVRLLRAGEQTYGQIREHIKTKGGVVIKGDLDHRLRQSLSRAVAAGTIVTRMRGEEQSYYLSKKEKEKLRKMYPGK
jgi:predicted MPP superfamily phosphohydrolase